MWLQTMETASHVWCIIWNGMHMSTILQGPSALYFLSPVLPNTLVAMQVDT